MSRRLPTAADVRAAIAGVQRALALSAAPLPESVTRVRWTKGEPGECPFCGETGPLVQPEGGAPVLCEATVADLHAATRPPRPGDVTGRVLAAVASWAGPPRDGEPPAQLPPASEPCATCGRAPEAVPDIAAGPEGSLCSDCLARAADAIAPAVRLTALETEAHAAGLEADDLARLVDAEGPDTVRRNATLALSLLRLLSAPGDEIPAKLDALLTKL